MPEDYFYYVYSFLSCPTNFFLSTWRHLITDGATCHDYPSHPSHWREMNQNFLKTSVSSCQFLNEKQHSTHRSVCLQCQLFTTPFIAPSVKRLFDAFGWCVLFSADLTRPLWKGTDFSLSRSLFLSATEWACYCWANTLIKKTHTCLATRTKDNHSSPKVKRSFCKKIKNLKRERERPWVE